MGANGSVAGGFPASSPWANGHNNAHSLRKVWEQDEIMRSEADARATTIRPADFRRYADPPSNTAYPLEYAFSLLGNILGKVVVDLGCGSGECLPHLAARGATVTGLDISPHLLAVAAQRLQQTGTEALLHQASVYETGLPSASVDVVFCIALLHHLELTEARKEVSRILRPGGVVIVMEPVRDSRKYDTVRDLVPLGHTHESNFERPLTSAELDEFTTGFAKSQTRRFRLPFIPALELLGLRSAQRAWGLDRKILRLCPSLNRYATVEVFKLRKPQTNLFD